MLARSPQRPVHFLSGILMGRGLMHSQLARTQSHIRDSIHIELCSNDEADPVRRFINLLRKCKEGKDRGDVKQLLACFRQYGLENHRSLGNSLVSTLAEVGCLNDAQSVFEKLVHRGASSWNSLISGYVKYGRPRQALSLYQSMPSKDLLQLSGYTFVALINACTKLKDLGQGISLHNEVDKMRWLQRDLFIGSSLIDMYAKCGSLNTAQEVFDALPSWDVVSWNSLITGYVGYGQSEMAIERFKQMQSTSVVPNAITYSCTLKACGNIGASDKGREIHAEAERRGLLEKDFVLATALVDMYAKCGVLSNAQEVFDRITVHDVIAWNSLITGYATHGYGQDALLHFELMQVEGVSPNSVTFISGLKACCSISEIEKGQAMHDEIIRKGLLEKNTLVGTSLVDMYAKCGMLRKAEEIFNQLPVRNVVSWNALISGFIAQECNEEALEIFNQMQYEGAPPNSVTYVCALKACTNIGAIDKGLQIHAEVDRNRLLDSDITVGTALVDMYLNCGLLTRAQQVFDFLPFHNVVSWNALITGYVECKHGELALQCFEKMQSEGVVPNVVTYVCVLRACGSVSALEKGIAVHFEVERQGMLQRDPIIGSAVVDMYGKCGSLMQAQEVFDKLPVRDVVTWNSLLCGYTDLGHGEEALKCFERLKLEGIAPDSGTFICSLRACSSIKDMENGRKIHQEIEREGLLKDDLVLGTTLMDMYIKCGLLDKAQSVFDELPFRSIISWNVLIVGYIDHGYGEEALECYGQMQAEGFLPDTVTYISILKACGSIRSIYKGREIHDEINTNECFRGNLRIGTAIVDMYIKCGSPNSARNVFDKLSRRDIVSWNSLIGGYAEQGNGDDALECFEKMQFEGVTPNAVTLSCVLKACSAVGATEKGLQVHSQIVKMGLLEQDIVIGSSLVEMYSKCGMQAVADEVFEKLSIRDVVSWNSLIAGYAQIGEINNVFRIFDRMAGEGINPDPFTFIVIFNACSRSGLFEQSETYFDAMSKVYGIIPRLEHQNCMVNLLCRAGQLDQAIAMTRELSFSSNLVALHTILSACNNSGNVTLGQRTFENAQKLNKSDGASYVLMSHIANI